MFPLKKKSLDSRYNRRERKKINGKGRKPFERKNSQKRLIDGQGAPSFPATQARQSAIICYSFPFSPLATHRQSFRNLPNLLLQSMTSAPTSSISPHSARWSMTHILPPLLRKCQHEPLSLILRGSPVLWLMIPSLVFFNINLYPPGWHPSHFECFELTSRVML